MKQTDTDKQWISAEELLADSFYLAQRIYDSGWRPDLLLVIWRGGALIGITIHEYLCYRGISIPHTVIQASSYSGIQKRTEVKFTGLKELSSVLQAHKKLLLIDDVWESGHTINTLIQWLQQHGHKREDIKVATPWYKPDGNQYPEQPDFCLHSSKKWLVFPHELCDLSIKELRLKPGLPTDLRLTD